MTGDLTPQEQTIVSALVRSRGEILSRRELLREIGSDGHPDLIKTLMHRIRARRPDLTIKTVHGEGYSLWSPDL